MQKFDVRGMPADSRLLGKPVSNEGDLLPVMEYDFRALEFTSRNIWQAQMAGWCRILTYDYVADKNALSSNRRAKRQESIIKAGVIYKPGMGWRDEYPFASTIENNGSVFIGHAPADEQRIQGGIISEFYRRHGADSYFARNGKSFFFEVRVINYPLGSITRLDTTWR